MRTCTTTLLMMALTMSAGSAAAAEQAALGGYRATATLDNRLLYTLNTTEFRFTRMTAIDTNETEITIAAPNEAAVVIRLTRDQLTVERGSQIVTIGRDGDDAAAAAAALMTGRGVAAFRRLVGEYERQVLNDTAVTARTSPFAYSLLLTAAFVGEIAGDPNAMARTRDLIRRRMAARVRAVAWQQEDCVTSYEKALLANDTRNTQCLESADNMDSFWDRAGARMLCAAEFLAGALSAETQFVSCSGLAPLKIQ